MGWKDLTSSPSSEARDEEPRRRRPLRRSVTATDGAGSPPASSTVSGGGGRDGDEWVASGEWSTHVPCSGWAWLANERSTESFPSRGFQPGVVSENESRWKPAFFLFRPVGPIPFV